MNPPNSPTCKSLELTRDLEKRVTVCTSSDRLRRVQAQLKAVQKPRATDGGSSEVGVVKTGSVLALLFDISRSCPVAEREERAERATTLDQLRRFRIAFGSVAHLTMSRRVGAADSSREKRLAVEEASLSMSDATRDTVKVSYIELTGSLVATLPRTEGEQPQGADHWLWEESGIRMRTANDTVAAERHLADVCGVHGVAQIEQVSLSSVITVCNVDAAMQLTPDKLTLDNVELERIKSCARESIMAIVESELVRHRPLATAAAARPSAEPMLHTSATDTSPPASPTPTASPPGRQRLVEQATTATPVAESAPPTRASRREGAGGLGAVQRAAAEEAHGLVDVLDDDLVKMNTT